MLVIEASRFGGPEVLAGRQVPDAAAGPGQVVVRTAAADVLFLDAMIRSGRGADYFPIRPPYVPGNGVAGQVTSVGDGVDPGWIGLPVVSRTGGAGGSGGYAEQVVVQADDLVAVPDGVKLPTAAAVLHDGATAISVLGNVSVKPDEWVLVTAAAGGMGVLLVQSASAEGARVIGAASGDRKLTVVRDAGAEAAIDYSDPAWASWVLDLTGGHGADVVLDGAGGRLGEAAFGITAPGGRFSAHGAPAGRFASPDPAAVADRGITMYGIPQYEPGERRRLVGAALGQAAAGRIRPVIGQTFPLERAADAHAAIEARATIAKTLLLA
jgi:NADPH:quinone reductase